MARHPIEGLPIPEALERWCRSLAVLDLVLFPDDWEARRYSFDPKWGRGTRHFEMRDGSGDHMHAIFTAKGAALRGFAHESAMSPWHSSRKEKKPTPWPGLFDGLPKALASVRTEPAFGEDEVTFCGWFADGNWQIGDIAFPKAKDPDGAKTLVACLTGTPASYAREASDYAEREIPLAVVKQICAGEPLTAARVQALNPEATLAEVEKEALALMR